MRALFSFKTWLLFSLVWVGSIAYFGLSNWPSLPLDVGANDPATLAIYNKAITQYVLGHVAAAVAVPLLALGVGFAACRMFGCRPN